MRKPKLRELGEAIRSFLSPPYTTRFPFEPSPAPPGYRGKGKFHEDECIGCGACAEICPSSAITVEDRPEDSPPVRVITRRDDHCIFCGQCQALCTTGKGVECTNEWDLATLDRGTCAVDVTKELVLCEACGAVISARDHLRWLAEKLGAKRFANPTLVLMGEARLHGAPAETGRPEAQLTRSDVLRILCPQCRRTVVLREIWG
ncbi:MAG: 4Fe-4S dicluster domain-containing protein [Planctomycetota bacterium]